MAEVGEKRSAEQAGLDEQPEMVAALTVNLHFHYFHVMTSDGKVQPLRTYDDGGGFHVSPPPAYDSPQHEIAYVWQLPGATPPSLPGFPGTIKKDDLQRVTVKKFRELLLSAPHQLYYGCYEFKDEEDHQESEFLTGYVQLFGSGEFFWAEGFPNMKFNSTNIGDLQVIGACLLTRDTASSGKQDYKEVTMLEMKDVTAKEDVFKQYVEPIKAKFGRPISEHDYADNHAKIIALEAENAALKAQLAALKGGAAQ